MYIMQWTVLSALLVEVRQKSVIRGYHDISVEKLFNVCFATCTVIFDLLQGIENTFFEMSSNVSACSQHVTGLSYVSISCIHSLIITIKVQQSSVKTQRD